MSRNPSSSRAAGPAGVHLLALCLVLLLVHPDTCHGSPSHRGRHHEHERAESSREDAARSGRMMSEELPRPAAFTNVDPLVVRTRKGMVRGKTLTSATGKEVDAWFGIPYAQKPLGTLFLRTREDREREREGESTHA